MDAANCGASFTRLFGAGRGLGAFRRLVGAVAWDAPEAPTSVPTSDVIPLAGVLRLLGLTAGEVTGRSSPPDTPLRDVAFAFRRAALFQRFLHAFSDRPTSIFDTSIHRVPGNQQR
jgi:hypothetical protein